MVLKSTVSGTKQEWLEKAQMLRNEPNTKTCTATDLECAMARLNQMSTEDGTDLINSVIRIWTGRKMDTE